MRLVRMLLCLVVLAMPLAAAERQPNGEGGGAAEDAASQPAHPRIRRVGPDLYQVGTVLLDAKKMTVRCAGRVNMDRGGPIELLACLPRGKTHESVFTLDVEPKDLQVALLLLGLRSGRNPAVRYPEDSPERSRPAGQKVVVSVQWHPQPEDGKEDEEREESRERLVTVRAERFLHNVQTDRPAAEAKWVFLGSRMVDGRFGADLDGTLITTYHDRLAILELALPTVNDDVYYVVNEEQCPPVGTPVELVIECPPKRKPDDAEKEPAETDKG